MPQFLCIVPIKSRIKKVNREKIVKWLEDFRTWQSWQTAVPHISNFSMDHFWQKNIDSSQKNDFQSLETMDWEALGTSGASFIQKVQKVTDSLTGKSSGSGESSSGLHNSKNSASAIPFASKDLCTNDEVWILGRKYFSQSGDDYLVTWTTLQFT